MMLREEAMSAPEDSAKDEKMLGKIGSAPLASPLVAPRQALLLQGPTLGWAVQILTISRDCEGVVC
jgi:hypothetical protein